MFINRDPRSGFTDGNWVNILNGAVVTYKNNKHITINMMLLIIVQRLDI